MKLNISINKQALNGYLNIDPLGGECKHSSNPFNLEGLVDTAECTEILATEMLDYIPTTQVMNILKYYVSKLRHGGKIVLGGTDLYSVAKDIITQRINIVQANELLYGGQTNPWDFKHSQVTMNDIAEILSSFGLKINKKRINGNKFIIEAERV